MMSTSDDNNGGHHPSSSSSSSSISLCYLKCLVDSCFDVRWSTHCNWVNYFTAISCADNFDPETYLFIQDDGKTILFASTHVFAYGKNGYPWASNIIKDSLNILPKEEIKSTFLYCGLFANEYKHNESLMPLSEHMKRHPFNCDILTKYIDKMIEMSSLHLLAICLSEDLLLIDNRNEDIFLCSPNFLTHFSHPLPDSFEKFFFNRMHPFVGGGGGNKRRERKTHHHLQPLLPHVKIKTYCANVINKLARDDAKNFICHFVYFLSSLATYWKLGIRFPDNYHKKMSIAKIKTKECPLVCRYSKNSSIADIKDKIHGYVCERVLKRLPKETKGSKFLLYPAYKNALAELKAYITSLDGSDDHQQ